MKKMTFLSLVLSLLLISVTAGAVQMPSEPTDLEVEYTVDLGCDGVSVFALDLYKIDKRGVTVSFWYIEQSSDPIIVIYDLKGEVYAVFVKPRHGEVLYYTNDAEAKQGPYPLPCDIWASYNNKTM